MKTFLALTFGVALTACGGSVDVPAQGGGSASGTSTTGGSTSNGVGGASTTGNAPDADSSTQSGVGGSGPKICGGIAGFECGPLAFCQFGGNCGGADEQGICVMQPADCSGPQPMPVCGCDGQIYTNACYANLAGVDVDTQPGACELADAGVSPSSFACGKSFCATGTEYCEHHFQATCMPLPPVCAAPNDNCACLLNAGCGICTGNPGQLDATCFK